MRNRKRRLARLIFTIRKLFLTYRKLVFIIRKIDLTMLKTFSDLADHPLAQLSREDLDMVTELVLRSGSLKDLAVAYGVSYPTIRARLDRVIERLRQAKAGQAPDPLKELLARLVERGEMPPAAARSVLGMVRQTAADAARTQGAQQP